MEISTRKENQKALFGILFAIFLLFAATFLPAIVAKVFAISYKNTFVVSRDFFWLCLFALMLYSVRIERKHLLIWQEKNYSFIFYFIAFAALFAILFFGVAIINGILVKVFHVAVHPEKLDKMLDVFKENRWLIYFTVITAGVVEELIFRGYLMPRLQILFKSKFWSIFISSALFGLLHFTYGTVLQVIGPFYIGLIFAIFYEKYRNIKTVIMVHALWDLMTISALLVSHLHK